MIKQYKEEKKIRLKKKKELEIRWARAISSNAPILIMIIMIIIIQAIEKQHMDYIFVEGKIVKHVLDAERVDLVIL